MGTYSVVARPEGVFLPPAASLGYHILQSEEGPQEGPWNVPSAGSSLEG